MLMFLVTLTFCSCYFLFFLLYVRGSHHQLFDIIKKGEIEAYIVLLYIFLMMFFSFVYLFDDCLVFSMLSFLKHPSS